MDPITGAVVAAVLWFVLRTIIAVAIVFAGFGVGFGVAMLTGKDALAVPFIILGWLAAIAWEIFALIQGWLAIVEIFQLVTA